MRFSCLHTAVEVQRWKPSNFFLRYHFSFFIYAPFSPPLPRIDFFRLVGSSSPSFFFLLPMCVQFSLTYDFFPSFSFCFSREFSFHPYSVHLFSLLPPLPPPLSPPPLSSSASLLIFSSLPPPLLAPTYSLFLLFFLAVAVSASSFSSPSSKVEEKGRKRR